MCCGQRGQRGVEAVRVEVTPAVERTGFRPEETHAVRLHEHQPALFGHAVADGFVQRTDVDDVEERFDGGEEVEVVG